MNRPTSSDYHSYLLRLWRTRADAPWQASLQSAKDDRVHTFEDMAELVSYLLTETKPRRSPTTIDHDGAHGPMNGTAENGATED